MRLLPRLFVGVGLAGVAASQVSLPPLGPTELTFEAANQLAKEPRWLSLRFADFDTRNNEPEMPADLRCEQPARGGHFLAQFDGPLRPATRDAIAELGATLVDYVPNYAYIVRATDEQRAALERLSEVVWSGELHPAYRLDPRLRWASLETEGATFELELVAVGFNGEEREVLERAVRRSGLTLVETAREFGRWIARVQGTARDARELARAQGVQWIEPASAPELRNNNSTWVVQTNSNSNTRVWDLGLRGEGEIIGHVDGPITAQPCWFRDPNNAPVGPTHRKIVYLDGTGADTHGTHTACTAAGDPEPINGTTGGRGLAYLAKLAHTDFPLTSFATVGAAHSNVGARIHTNSWGDDTTTAYNTLCQSIDAFQWNHEDELVFFAISNTQALTNPDSTKNMVAVGATQNGIAADVQCVFSAGGPTFDGRRKPDLMAPGCSVTSAATGACATTSLNGTSMATPAAAAAGALVRQYFRDGFHPSGVARASDGFTPSAALIKAVLVNAAQDVTGIAGYPSNFEGWGRINLDATLYFQGDADKLFVSEVRNANGLSTNDVASFTVFVQSSAPFELTLAFTDAPGTLNASNPVVNDLDLEVLSPSNIAYLGNVFSGGFSATGGVADAKNNVERAAFAVPEVGAWTVRVRATNVAQGRQGFGLCASGDISVGGTSSPTSYCTSSQTTNFCAPIMTTAGYASVGSTSSFVLSAQRVEGQRQGLIFYGVTGPLAQPWRPGSSSFQCVRQPLQRTAAHNSGGTLGGCDGALVLDWSAYIAARPGALGQPFSPGSVVHAQAWFRDPQAPDMSNLSNGVEFTVQQ